MPDDEAIELPAGTTLTERLGIELSKRGIYCLFGEITSGACETASSFLLTRLFQGSGRATILICSQGGDGDASRGLVGVMEMVKAKGLIVKTIATGQAASAAFDILIAGSKGERICTDTTLLMTHSTSVDARDRGLIDLLEKVDDQILMRYTTLDRKKINAYAKVGGNLWMSAKEGLDAGVVDRIIQVNEVLDVD
jgi:ATP-dependent protease ClpP protease subunit